MENNLNKQRILVNKYTDVPADIIASAFYSGYGEVILSIKKGEEGIYAKNDAGEIIKLGVDETLINQLIDAAIEGERDRAMAAESELSQKVDTTNLNLEELDSRIEVLSGEVKTISTNINDVVEEAVNNKLADLGMNVHQDISMSDYETLVKNGEVTILDRNGNLKTIKYDDTTYYMIYDDVETSDENVE